MPENLFTSSNTQGLCAGMSSHWVKSSLKNGGMKVTWDQSDDVVAMRSHMEIPNASRDRIAMIGLRKVGNELVLQNETWARIVETLCRQTGYCYLTMKQPAHAMACFVDKTHIYFFDPNSGLQRMTHLEALRTLLQHFRISWATEQNLEFKIYKVELEPNHHHQKLPAPPKS